METLQYNAFLPVSSFLSTETLPHYSQHRPYMPLPFQPSSLYKYNPTSTTPPSSTTSLVTDISDSLNSIKVSSPHESPQSKQQSQSRPISPPSLLLSQKPPRARRNLSLSMDSLMRPPLRHSSPPPPSRLPSSTSAEDLLSCSPPVPSICFPETIINKDPAATESPCKSPKRARGDEDEVGNSNITKDECCTRFDEAASSYTPQQPLFRSASDNTLDENNSKGGKLRARSLLMKSESCYNRKWTNSTLPAFYGTHPDLQYITPQTVVEVMEGKFKDTIDEHFIIDCRFPYEYEGGHIKTALNLTENEIKQMFIDTPLTKKVAIIFHCEFSSQRAPRCCRFLRELDRKINFAEYPRLTYPDVYVIEGGYKNFFETYENYCNGTYIEMRDERHFTEMKAHLRTIKRVRSMSADNSTIPFFQPSKFGL